MAVILGEAYPDVFAGVGAHSGLPVGSARDVPSAFAAMAGRAIQSPDPEPGAALVRTIVFHGTGDATVHPSNSDAIARRARARHAPQSLETSCGGDAAGRGYTRDLSCGADGTAIVEVWTIDGLGHAWSGGRAGGSHTDVTGPDASAEMVRFFFDPMSSGDPQ